MELKTYYVDPDTHKKFKIYCDTYDKKLGETITYLMEHEINKNPVGSIPNLLEDSPQVIAEYLRDLSTEALKKAEWLGRIIEVYASAYVQIEAKERVRTVFQSPAHAERFGKSGAF